MKDKSLKINPDPCLDSPLLADYYGLVFSDLKEGVMLIDRDGSLLKANPAALQMHGLDEEEAKRMSASPAEHFIIYDLAGKELPLEQWPFKRVLNKETFENVELVVAAKSNGRKLFASFSGRPHFDAEGNFKVGMLYIKDISAEARTRLELEKIIEERNRREKDLKIFQQQIRDDRQLLQTIIDTIPVMIVIYDARVKKVTLNKAVEKITGWTDEDIEKATIMELAYPDPDYREKVYEYMTSLKPGFKDLIMRTKDGRSIETSWANVKIPDGRQVGVGIDVSERKQLEEELRRSKEKAEKENLVQSAFIQNISHEVRTPMNSIIGFTELLQRSIYEGKEREYLDSISINGKQLLRLIDDIVDFSRLDKNEMSLAYEEIPVQKIMEDIHKQLPGLQRKYQKRHLEIASEMPPENHDQIILHTDVHRLQQVMINLLSNALKYTEKGTISYGYTRNEDKKHLEFYVKDSGIGIKKEDHQRVFKRFNRLHDTRKTDFRGTGLGLAICKHLVELLGGNIHFESAQGEG